MNIQKTIPSSYLISKFIKKTKALLSDKVNGLLVACKLSRLNELDSEENITIRKDCLLVH